MEDEKHSSPMRFEDLEAWNAARELTTVTYRLCRHEPLSRDFGPCDQLRRAAVSVMNNVFARRSCGEVRSMSYVLLDNSYVSDGEYREIYDRAVRCGKLVSGLMHSAERRK